MNALVFYRSGNEGGTVREVDVLFPGVGECDCHCCEGSDIYEGHPERVEKCNECKGSGRMYVSI